MTTTNPYGEQRSNEGDPWSAWQEGYDAAKADLLESLAHSGITLNTKDNWGNEQETPRTWKVIRK